MDWKPIHMLVREFEDRSLPKDEWTHTAHVRVALWYLWQRPKSEAFDALREGIKAYNLATGGQNTETSGYHETITWFWVEAVSIFLADQIGQPMAEVEADAVRTFASSSLPLLFFSRDRLFTPEARQRVVSPDLCSLTPESIANLTRNDSAAGVNHVVRTAS